MWKRAFYTTEMSLKHNGIVSIFQKGLTHDFIKNLKVVSISLKKTYTWCLIIFLKKEKRFLDYKNVNLKLCEKPIFPKGVPRDFPQKLDISSQSHFVWKLPKNNV